MSVWEWAQDNWYSLSSVGAGLVSRNPYLLASGLAYTFGQTLLKPGYDDWDSWDERPRTQGFNPRTWGRNMEDGVYGMGNR